LRELKLAPDSSHLPFVTEILANWPGHISEGEMVELEQLVMACFQLDSTKAKAMLKSMDPTKTSSRAFEDVVSTNGWFGSYLQETLASESPTAFHFMCACVALGAMTDRRFWVSKGHYRVYPNLNLMLIAPTGKCRKTASINIMLDVLMKAKYEKFIVGVTTPEAFVLDIGANDPASCIVIGREMAAFFRKSKYLEGMIPLFTDLIDCPDEWRSLTIGRGKLVLKNVMMSGVYGTTMDWVNTNLPPDVFGGGFMRRHLISHQTRTTRLSPLGDGWDQGATRRLADGLTMLTTGVHEFKLDGDARNWYINWYTKSKSSPTHEGEERMEGYLESKPDHLLRVAMLLQLSGGKRELTTESLERGLQVLDWLEQFLPQAFSAMASSSVGEMEDKILRYIRNAGGRMTHSDLVRRMSKYVTADKLYQMVNTLKEGEMLEEKPKTAMEGRSYYITRKAKGGE
jgi:hypothetical protein